MQVTTTAQVCEGSQEVSSNQSESLPTDQLTTSTESTITEEVTASVSEYPPCPEQQPASTEGIQLQAVQVVEDLPVMPEA